MNTRQQRQLARAEREASEFNAKHQPGTPVLYHKVIGRPETAVETKTRSVAWALPSGEPGPSTDGQPPLPGIHQALWQTVHSWSNRKKVVSDTTNSHALRLPLTVICRRTGVGVEDCGAAYFHSVLNPHPFQTNDPILRYTPTRDDEKIPRRRCRRH